MKRYMPWLHQPGILKWELTPWGPSLFFYPDKTETEKAKEPAPTPPEPAVPVARGKAAAALAVASVAAAAAGAALYGKSGEPAAKADPDDEPAGPQSENTPTLNSIVALVSAALAALAARAKKTDDTTKTPKEEPAETQLPAAPVQAPRMVRPFVPPIGGVPEAGMPYLKIPRLYMPADKKEPVKTPTPPKVEPPPPAEPVEEKKTPPAKPDRPMEKPPAFNWHTPQWGGAPDGWFPTWRPQETWTQPPVEETVKPPSEEGDRRKESLLIEAIRLHEVAVAGDKAAVEKAYEILEQLRSIDPHDPLVQAFYGSIITLFARDMIDPRERVSKGLQGHRILTQAVEKDPHNLWARILRAFVSYRLPEDFFHRTHIAVEDFDYLVSRYQEDPAVFTPQFYSEILYHLGCAHRTLDEPEKANAVWSKLWRETTEPRYRDLLRRHGFQPEDGPEAKDYPCPQPGQPTTFNFGANFQEMFQDMMKPRSFSPTKKASYEQASDEELDEGVELHTRAREGDREATRSAYEYFSQLHRDYPEDDLVTAYYADCLSMTGRDATDSSQQFTNAISAIQMLEQTVNRCPDDVEIRMLRGYHAFRLPEAFFRRTKTAIEDFEYIIQQYEEDDSLLTPGEYWQLLYDLGQAYQRIGNEEQAQSVWEKLLADSPDEKYRSLIESQKFDEEPVLEKLSVLNDPEELRQEGIRLFNLAVDSSPKAAKAAHQALKKAHELDPQNLETLAYYGCATALLGRDSKDAGTMFETAIHGLRTLNKAVNRDPDNPHFRVLRGFLTSSLPESFFHMTESAIEDFEFAMAACQQDPGRLPQDLYWRMLYELASVYERINQKDKAFPLWSELSAHCDDPRYQNLAESKL